MSLFDKFSGSKQESEEPLTPEEGILGVLLLVIAADGDISDEESEELVAISNRMKLLRSLSPHHFSEIITKLTRIIRQNGMAVLFEKAIPALPKELTATVFALACDLVFSDGYVDDSEKALIEDLQLALAVTDDLAEKIVEVISIKNQG